jgi:cyclopropane fatty-acyl-phospholipid synthase-like methyltransferase
MDAQKQYELSAATEGLRRNMSQALIERDRFVIDNLREIRRLRQLDVLELSVGDGRMTLALSRLTNMHLTCAEISALRISQVQAEIAASAQTQMPRFVNCDLDNDFADFSSSAFDAAIALDILEHVFDVFGFVSNCHRILRPGGLLYLRVPNIAYVKHRIALLRGQLPVTASWFGARGSFSAWRETHGWDGGHLHLFTVPTLTRLLREGGFTILSCSEPGATFAKLRKAWPNLLFANPLVVAMKTEK